ncbi:hypothetical protein [African swine fever virus]|nr:unnamed protein [African swine fever virus]WMQ66058.1 hypothetical protein [African swine fever virus]WMZ41379.1 hypothetical protein [African swine fever virus]
MSKPIWRNLKNRSWASNKVFLPIILMKSLMDWQSHWALTLMTLNFRLTPHTVLYLKNPRVGAAIRYTAAYAAIAYVLTAYVVIVYVAAAYAAAAYAAAVYAMAVYAAAVCAMAVYAMAVCAAVRRAEALHATVVHVMTAVILFLRIEKNMQSLRHLKKQLFLKEIVKTTMLKASIVKKVLNLVQSK